jgi:hypothetical protein
VVVVATAELEVVALDVVSGVVTGVEDEEEVVVTTGTKRILSR